MVTLNNARVKARNAKRNDDIVQLIKAFQLAADNAGGVFPVTGNLWACVSTDCITSLPIKAISDFIKPYINTPTDPPGHRNGLFPDIYGYSYYRVDKTSNATMVWYLDWQSGALNCGPGQGNFHPGYFVQCIFKFN